MLICIYTQTQKQYALRPNVDLMSGNRDFREEIPIREATGVIKNNIRKETQEEFFSLRVSVKQKNSQTVLLGYALLIVAGTLSFLAEKRCA